MRAFAEALPIPLTAEERARFQALYERQPCLGGLPLILLMEWLGPVREIVCEILDNPTDRELWGVLLRALEFQAGMVRNKRDSERHYKRQRQDGKNSSALLIETSGLSTVDVAKREGSALDELQQIAAELREKRQAACSCRTTSHWFATTDEDRTSADMLVFIDRCSRCDQSEEVSVSAAEARLMYRELQGDWGSR